MFWASESISPDVYQLDFCFAYFYHDLFSIISIETKNQINIIEFKWAGKYSGI